MVLRSDALSAVSMTSSSKSRSVGQHYADIAIVEQPISLRHLNQIDLARRWRVSPRTLERWRWQKLGPAYLKVGNHVVYRIEDVEAYEAGRRRASAAA